MMPWKPSMSKKDVFMILQTSLKGSASSQRNERITFVGTDLEQSTVVSDHAWIELKTCGVAQESVSDAPLRNCQIPLISSHQVCVNNILRFSKKDSNWMKPSVNLIVSLKSWSDKNKRSAMIPTTASSLMLPTMTSKSWHSTSPTESHRSKMIKASWLRFRHHTARFWIFSKKRITKMKMTFVPTKSSPALLNICVKATTLWLMLKSVKPGAMKQLQFFKLKLTRKMSMISRKVRSNRTKTIQRKTRGTNRMLISSILLLIMMSMTDWTRNKLINFCLDN